MIVTGVRGEQAHDGRLGQGHLANAPIDVFLTLRTLVLGQHADQRDGEEAHQPCDSGQNEEQAHG